VGEAEMRVSFSPVPETGLATGVSKRLGCMQGLGIVAKHIDIKAFGREEIIALFEGRP
jgi:hypothetical protein